MFCWYSWQSSLQSSLAIYIFIQKSCKIKMWQKSQFYWVRAPKVFSTQNLHSTAQTLNKENNISATTFAVLGLLLAPIQKIWSFKSKISLGPCGDSTISRNSGTDNEFFDFCVGGGGVEWHAAYLDYNKEIANLLIDFFFLLLIFSMRVF